MNSARQGTLLLHITNVITTGLHQMDHSTKHAEAAIIGSVESEFTQWARTILSSLKDNAMQGSPLLERTAELKDIATKVESMLKRDADCQSGNLAVTLQLQTLHASLEDLIQKLDRRDDTVGRDITKIESTMTELSDLLKENIRSTRSVEQQVGPLISSSGSDEAAAGRRQRMDTDMPGLGPQKTDTLISVQATLSMGRQCEPSCYCQCHQNTAVRSPGVLSGILGRLLLAWNAATLWRNRTCDHPKCKHSSAKVVRLTYVFPRWMLHRALAASLSWGGITGAGADLRLAIPYVIGRDHIAWLVIADNDVPWLQREIARTRMTLTEVFDNGESLLMVKSLNTDPTSRITTVFG